MSNSQVKQPVEEFLGVNMIGADMIGGNDIAKRLSVSRSLSRLAGLLAICISLIGLIGSWGDGMGVLQVVHVGDPSIEPRTAIGPLFCGLAVWLADTARTQRAKRFFSRACAAIVCFIGVVRLLAYPLADHAFTGKSLLLNSVTPIVPDRAAAMAAVGLLFLGAALLLSGQRRCFEFGQYLIVAVVGLALFNLIASVYGISTFSGQVFKANTQRMAIHTSFTYLILCAGTLLSRPDWGLMSTIGSAAPGSAMARQLLPAALLIPLLMSWLGWQGQLAGLYNGAFGETLSTSITIAVFTFLIWTNVGKLNKLDSKRSQAERNLRQLADSMPQMVWTATPDGVIDYYNQRWSEYTGLNFQQNKDWDWKRAVHHSDEGAVKDLWTRALILGVTFEAECRLRCASNNTYRWHRAHFRFETRTGR